MVTIEQQPASAASSSLAPLVSFPRKLHEMLSEARDKGFEHIISWSADGKSFKVFDKYTFVDEVLQQYFELQTHFKSFTRQLK